MKKRQNPEWSNFSLAVSRYYFEYFRYFVDLNPDYQNDLRDTLFPLFLAIYGEHQPPKPAIYTRDCFYQAVNLVRGDDEAFYCYLKFELKDKDQRSLETACIEFGNAFRQFLRRYQLNHEGFSNVSNHALASIVYFSVFIGDPRVVDFDGGLQTNYPEPLLESLWTAIPKDEWIRLFERQVRRAYDFGTLDHLALRRIEAYKEEPRLPRHLPPAEPFQFLPPYDTLLGTVAEYEAKAVEEYREHIRAYLSNLKDELEKHGVKRFKTEDVSQIERLVIWNQHDFEYLWEVIEHIPEFCHVDMSNDRQVKSTTDKLRKSFTKLESLNLPVRPFGKKRKNPDPQNAT